MARKTMVRRFLRTQRGVLLLPKDCKRLAELDSPIGAVSEVERYWLEVNATPRPMTVREAPPPIFEEHQGFVVVTFKAEMVAGGATPHETAQVTGQVAEQVLEFCRTPRKASEIQELLGLRHRETFINNYLHPLLETGWIERTIPDKPRSRLQKYRLTAVGEAALKERGKDAK
ncbi:MAG: hypothetical protein FJ279_00265 [Planctomycetes bacterium]|nr:hypothetical protein [Planctomycetota bacterium]